MCTLFDIDLAILDPNLSASYLIFICYAVFYQDI